MLDREKLIEWIENHKDYHFNYVWLIDYLWLKTAITNGDLDVKEEK